MSILRYLSSVTLASALVLSPFHSAKAISGGIESLAVGVGSSSIYSGKKKNNAVLKYAGWTLVSLGGVVIAADVGGAVVLSKAITDTVLPMLGEIWKQIFEGVPSNLNDALKDFDPRKQTRLPVSSLLSEVENEVSLATNLESDEGAANLAISELAKALRISRSELALSMDNAIRAADQMNAGAQFAPEVRSMPITMVRSFVEVRGSFEQKETVEKILTNYLRLRNIQVEI